MLIASAIGSLRQLSELQYPKIVEAVSRMEAILREDPAGIHARSDFATRDRCRRIVEECARQSKTSEWDVAQSCGGVGQGALSQAAVSRCVAYYLLDDGLLGARERASGAAFPGANGGCDSFTGIRHLLYLASSCRAHRRQSWARFSSRRTQYGSDFTSDASAFGSTCAHSRPANSRPTCCRRG